MRPDRRIIFGLIGIVAIAATGVLVWRWFQLSTPSIDANDEQQVTQGRVVYAAQCAQCHGADLQGQPNWRERQANGRLPAPPQDANGHTWHHPDSVLFGITKHGISAYAPPGYESDMPTYDGILTDDDIAAVLAYIKSQWPPDIRARQERINGQAEQ